MVYMEYFLKVDLIVSAVSLFTMFVLMLLEVPIPGVLVAIFMVSLLLVFVTLIIYRMIDSNTNDK